jgi:putative oxidoreductase
MKAAFLIGRILFGGFFLYSGINHFRKRRMLADYIRSKAVPAPDAAVVLSGLMLAAGGTSIILGLKPRYGALAVTAFLAGASPLMHDFWRQQDPNQRVSEFINFSKNLALLGGALALMGIDRDWPVSASKREPKVAERVLEIVRKLAA